MPSSPSPGHPAGGDFFVVVVVVIIVAHHSAISTLVSLLRLGVGDAEREMLDEGLAGVVVEKSSSSVVVRSVLESSAMRSIWRPTRLGM
jgi:hypothetical protein